MGSALSLHQNSSGSACLQGCPFSTPKVWLDLPSGQGRPIHRPEALGEGRADARRRRAVKIMSRRYG